MSVPLKKAVVVVNEYTVKDKTTGKGSKGSTPKDFVLKYMARVTATDPLTPLSADNSEPDVTPHMSRRTSYAKNASATRAARGKTGSSVVQLAKELQHIDHLASVAFGRGCDPRDTCGETKTRVKAVRHHEPVRNVSMSTNELKAAANMMQTLFDQGHTIMKTVISFDPEYLYEMGVVADSFTPIGRHVTPAGDILDDIDEIACAQLQYRVKTNTAGHLVRDEDGNPIGDDTAEPLGMSHAARYKGDYRGNIDQMRLRRAIMSGLERLERSYDDLRYVAVIQVDTRHVHCHLAMVDAGVGTVNDKSGVQKGTLSQKDIDKIRAGVDASLRQSAGLQPLASQIRMERAHAKSLIQSYLRQGLVDNAPVQAIIAALPDERRLWRAGSHDRRMRHANSLMRDYVTNRLDAAGVWPQINQALKDYAFSRAGGDSYADKQQRETLMTRGREQLLTDCMNAGYQSIKQLVDEGLDTGFVPKVSVPEVTEVLLPTNRVTRQGLVMEPRPAAKGTPLYTSSLDYPTLARLHIEREHDRMFQFAYKLRSYGSRLNFHRDQRRYFLNEAHYYERLMADPETRDKIDPASVSLYQYYCFEAQYQWMLMDKYRYLFNAPASMDNDGRMNVLDSLNHASYILRAKRMMSMDVRLQHMDPVRAEIVGLGQYGVHGGRLLATGSYEMFDTLLRRSREQLMDRVSNVNEQLAEVGLKVTGDGFTTPFELGSGLTYPFEQTRGLDMHHLAYDFTHDFVVDESPVEMFRAMATLRRELSTGARAYIVDSGQSDKVTALPFDDIASMSRLAQSMERTVQAGKRVTYHRKALDEGLDERAQGLVRGSVEAPRLDVDVAPPLSQVINASAQVTLDRLRAEGGVDLGNIGSTDNPGMDMRAMSFATMDSGFDMNRVLDSLDEFASDFDNDMGLPSDADEYLVY